MTVVATFTRVEKIEDVTPEIINLVTTVKHRDFAGKTPDWDKIWATVEGTILEDGTVLTVTGFSWAKHRMHTRAVIAANEDRASW